MVKDPFHGGSSMPLLSVEFFKQVCTSTHLNHSQFRVSIGGGPYGRSGKAGIASQKDRDSVGVDDGAAGVAHQTSVFFDLDGGENEVPVVGEGKIFQICAEFRRE